MIVMYTSVVINVVIFYLPQQEQLAAFEMEKQILLGKSKNAEHEIESLSREYAKLLGHQNQKQKIHHILKLKEESLALKQVCYCSSILLLSLCICSWCVYTNIVV